MRGGRRHTDSDTEIPRRTRASDDARRMASSPRDIGSRNADDRHGKAVQRWIEPGAALQRVLRNMDAGDSHA